MIRQTGQSCAEYTLTGEPGDTILLTNGPTFAVSIYLGNDDFISCIRECIGKLFVNWRKALEGEEFRRGWHDKVVAYFAVTAVESHDSRLGMFEPQQSMFRLTTTARS